MSNLARYKGNFVSFADNEFEFQSSTVKHFAGKIIALDLSVRCCVGIFPSPSEETIVEIDTPAPDDFTVVQKGSTLVIQQKCQAGSTTVVNGATISGDFVGGNISITNNEIYINGTRYDATQHSSKQPGASRIRVYGPPNLDLDAELSGSSILASKIIFDHARVDVSGIAAVGLAARSLNLDLSGQGENYAVLKGGSLDVDVSGQGKVRVKGDFPQADVSVSGMGSVASQGICQGNYRASVSGMGSISHSGRIHGRVKKSLSGMGSINLE